MILLVLQAAALAVLVTQGSIFDSLRAASPKLLQELLVCPLCFGFWTGVLGALVHAAHWAYPIRELVWFVFGTGALSGCTAWLFSAVIERLEGVEGADE